MNGLNFYVLIKVIILFCCCSVIPLGMIIYKKITGYKSISLELIWICLNIFISIVLYLILVC